MTRTRRTELSPDGVRIVVDWAKFAPGSSIFIPCINTSAAINQLTEVTNLTRSEIATRVRVENGLYGVRVWRIL